LPENQHKPNGNLQGLVMVKMVRHSMK